MNQKDLFGEMFIGNVKARNAVYHIPLCRRIMTAGNAAQ